MNDGYYVGIGFLNYYWYILKEWYLGYPLVIRFVVISITAITFVGLNMIGYMLVRAAASRRELRIAKRISTELHETVEAVLRKNDAGVDYVGLERRMKGMKKREKRWLIRLVRDIWIDLPKEERDPEQLAWLMVHSDLRKYAEWELTFAPLGESLRLLRSMRLLGFDMNKGQFNVESSKSGKKMRRSSDGRIRRIFEYYVMWDSESVDWPYISSADYEKNFSKFDLIMFHMVLVHRKEKGLALPDVFNWVYSKDTNKAKPMMVRELRMCGSKMTCQQLVELFKHSNYYEALTEVAIFWAEMNYTKGCQLLMRQCEKFPKVKQQRDVVHSIGRLGRRLRLDGDKVGALEVWHWLLNYYHKQDERGKALEAQHEAEPMEETGYRTQRYDYRRLKVAAVEAIWIFCNAEAESYHTIDYDRLAKAEDFGLFNYIKLSRGNMVCGR